MTNNPPHRFFGIILNMPHIGDHRVQPILPNHLVQFTHALFVGGKLGPQISDILVRISRRIFGAR